MKKEIRVLGLHPYSRDAETFLKCFHIQELSDDFEFLYDEINPEYIVATELIFKSPQYRKKFNSYKHKDCIRIFYAGEAVSPDFNIFDYAIGWDANLKNGDRFCLLPSQFVFASEGFISTKYNSISTIEEAKEELGKKTGFCNFLYSNAHAHPMRDQLFYKICEYKKVDSLGRHLNNVEAKGTGFVGHQSECKDIKSQYKFSIACENAIFPGYTSEKIFTSLLAHTVPIYWGDPEAVRQINPACFINANSFNSLDEILSEVKRIDNDNECWCKMVSSPWMTDDQYDLAAERDQNAINFFRHIFLLDVQTSKRAPQGTQPDSYKNDYFYKAIPYIRLIVRIKLLILKILKLLNVRA